MSPKPSSSTRRKAAQFNKGDAPNGLPGSRSGSWESLEASFLVAFSDFERLHESKLELQRLNEQVKITFLDHQEIYSWS